MAITIEQIFNTIRDNSSAMYAERVPALTKSNFSEVGKAITVNDLTMNEFITGMVNKIALQNVVSKLFNNPLSRLKSTGVPLGNSIEEVFINPATDTGWQDDGALLLKTTKPDGKVCYYSMNRKGRYPVSINEVQFRRAFTSEQTFMSFYDSIVVSMYSGDNIDEFILMKQTVASAIDNGAVTIIPSDITQAKTLMKAISSYSKDFAFPSTAYAGYNLVNKLNAESEEKPCVTFCPQDRQALLIRADVQTEIDYEVLATMFHMEVAKLEAITVLVDTIPSTKYDVYALLCDIDTLQFRDADEMPKVQSMYNGSNLTWNFFLHHWEYMFFSMFGNAVAFGKEILTPGK